MNIKPAMRQGFTLALILSLILITGAQAAVHLSAVAPLQAEYKQDQSAPLADGHSAGRRHFARVQRAAICTEDLAQISFNEYAADWSAWMTQVATRWSAAMNSTAGVHKLQPYGSMWVEMTCRRDGTLADVTVHRSSGDEKCDAAQLQALNSCLPLPSFPVQSRKKSISLMFVWDYSISSRIAKTARRAVEQRTSGERISITGKMM